jgi:hypothetical protein
LSAFGGLRFALLLPRLLLCRSFITKLHHPELRQQIQPSLVYSMLALSVHMSAWDGLGGRGFEGRVLALKLMDQAQASFWSSWNSGWIDDGLAKAAFASLLAFAS